MQHPKPRPILLKITEHFNVSMAVTRYPEHGFAAHVAEQEEPMHLTLFRLEHAEKENTLLTLLSELEEAGVLNLDMALYRYPEGVFTGHEHIHEDQPHHELWEPHHAAESAVKGHALSTLLADLADAGVLNLDLAVSRYPENEFATHEPVHEMARHGELRSLHPAEYSATKRKALFALLEELAEAGVLILARDMVQNPEHGFADHEHGLDHSDETVAKGHVLVALLAELEEAGGFEHKEQDYRLAKSVRAPVIA